MVRCSGQCVRDNIGAHRCPICEKWNRSHGDRFTGSYISPLESGRRTANREVIEFLAMRLGVKAEELGMTSPLAMPGDIDERSIGV